MRSLKKRLIPFLCLVALGASPADDARKSTKNASSTLAMTKPVLCKEVRGYRDFEPLDTTSFTRDDKLLLYSEPTGFTTQPDKDKKGFRAHLTSDARVRKKGRKEILFEKKNMLDYEVTAPYPPKLIYLRTVFAIKGLGPGEYELDLILKDALKDDRTTTQVVLFNVIAAKPNDPPTTKPQPDTKTQAPRIP